MRSMHISRAAGGVAALLLTVVLAGCDDEDPPEPIESSSEPTPPSTNTTTEPTPTGPVEPTLPPEANAETRAGATAFVAHYWAVVTYARRTGDVGPLRDLSDPTCAGCNGAIKSITRVYDRGGRIIGGEFHVVRSTPGRTPSGAWNVSTRVDVERSRTVNAGDFNQVVRAGEVDYFFGLERVDDAWRATFLDAP